MEAKPYGVIYLITNTVNGKVYVGLTTQTLSARWTGHLGEARRGAKTSLHCAIRKYGADSFTRREIHEANSKEELLALEIAEIAEYRSTEPEFGYNLTYGGEGVRASPEAAEKLRQARRSYAATPEGAATLSAARKGKPWSPTERLKHESVRSIYWADPANRERRVELLRKVCFTPEALRKQSEAGVRRYEDQTERDRQAERMRKRFEKQAERDRLRQTSRAMWTVPGFRESHAASQSAYWSSKESHIRASQALLERYKDPAAKAVTQAAGKNFRTSEEGLALNVKHSFRLKENHRMKKAWAILEAELIASGDITNEKTNIGSGECIKA